MLLEDKGLIILRAIHDYTWHTLLLLGHLLFLQCVRKCMYSNYLIKLSTIRNTIQEIILDRSYHLHIFFVDVH
jgi:hypothetical protein